ncbi:hypothetical protein PBY51_020473 [Eleginops maclovinus]|uniref:Uncharacterized protein n=1 Tax=Eleginops maclovinus TaxID=56733 RepID=A0AAN7XTR0_ELEMC|nr:hypothetical protein PBY51_020473 [Eleginops maclovinus]
MRCHGETVQWTHSTVILRRRPESTLNPRGAIGVVSRSLGLHCQADLGAVGLNTEDPVFSCPSLQPPPNEAPRLPTSPPSPEKNSYTDGGAAV